MDDSDVGNFRNASFATSIVTRQGPTEYAPETDQNNQNAAAMNATGLSLPLSVRTMSFAATSHGRTLQNTIINNDLPASLQSLNQKLVRMGVNRDVINRKTRTEVAGIQLETEVYDARLERLGGCFPPPSTDTVPFSMPHEGVQAPSTAFKERTAYLPLERGRVDTRPNQGLTESNQSRGDKNASTSPLAENVSAAGSECPSRDVSKQSRLSDKQLRKLEDYRRRLKIEYKFVKEKHEQLSNKAKQNHNPHPVVTSDQQRNTNVATANARSVSKVLFADEKGTARKNRLRDNTVPRQHTQNQVIQSTRPTDDQRHADTQTAVHSADRAMPPDPVKSDDFAHIKQQLAEMKQRFLTELQASAQLNAAAKGTRTAGVLPSTEAECRLPALPQSPCRRHKLHYGAARADGLSDVPLAPKSTLHFVPSKATGASHSLNANLQQFLCSLKTENPLLHQVCLRLGANAPMSKLIHACRVELTKRRELLQADLSKKLRLYGGAKQRLDALLLDSSANTIDVSAAAGEVHQCAHTAEVADAALNRVDKQLATLNSMAESLRSPGTTGIDHCGARPGARPNAITRSASVRSRRQEAVDLARGSLMQPTVSSASKVQQQRQRRTRHGGQLHHQQHAAALRNLRRLTDAMRA